LIFSEMRRFVLVRRSGTTIKN